MIEWAVTASVLILAVAALRRCLMGKISLRLQYGLWLLVLVRLLLPVSFGGTAVSVLNAVEGVREPRVEPVAGYVDNYVQPAPASKPDSGLPPVETQAQAPWQAQPDTAPEEAGVPIAPQTVLLALWAAGAAGLSLWLLWVNVRFARRLRRSRRPLAEAGGPLPVYVTGAIGAPCLFGLVRPRIYVTEEVAADETILHHSLAHELTHYRHGDHVWSALREELMAFADEVNALLRRSELLLSTEDGWVNMGPAGEGSYLEELRALEAVWPKSLWSPEADSVSLPEEPVEFLLASGASSWGTLLTLAPDGSFTGDYGNTEMVDGQPSRYVCTFHGQFTDIRQTGTYTWSLTLAELTTEQVPGERWREDGLQYIASEALGVEGGTEFILYAPGTPAYDLPAECWNWWPDACLWRAGEQDTLDGWCLYQVADGYGFFQRGG